MRRKSRKDIELEPIPRKKFREMMMEVHYRSIADEMVHTHRRRQKSRPFMHEHYPSSDIPRAEWIFTEYWFGREILKNQ